MIGLVALIVAVVILVFFGIGYLFGRSVSCRASETVARQRPCSAIRPHATTLAFVMLLPAVFGIHNSALNLAVELRHPVPGRDLAGARLLDVSPTRAGGSPIRC